MQTKARKLLGWDRFMNVGLDTKRKKKGAPTVTQIQTKKRQGKLDVLTTEMA